MPVTDLVQNSFTAGELDPKLRSRFDIATYYSGAAKIRNAMVRPQGAVARRPGSVYRGEVPFGNVKTFEFVFSQEETYTMILTPYKMTVYKEGEKLTEIACTITNEQVPDVTAAQSYDSLLIFHEEFHPKAFVRESSTVWHTFNWDIQNPPTGTYADTSTVDSTLSVYQGDGTTPIDFTEWYTGNEYSNAKLKVTTAWPLDIVGFYVRGPAGGYAKVIARDDDLTITAIILAPFSNDPGNSDETIMQSGEWSIEESVWSSDRGYPRCGTFFQGRLWMAGTREKPNTIWASRTNNENDFRNWIPSYADDGIEASAGGGTQARFVRLFAGKHLFIFADEGEFYIPISAEEPVVPTNISIKRNSSYGCKTDVEIVEVNGSIVYLRKGGKSLIESTFNFAAGSYQNIDLNLLSSHVLNDPKSLAYRKHTSTDDSDYIFVVNGDGSIAVLCTLREQDVNGWALQFTDGHTLSVAVENRMVYFIVDRIVDGNTVRMLETLEFGMFHDSGVLKQDITPFHTVEGLDHLIGEEVAITLDNTIQEPQIVPLDGIITLERSGNYCSVGLPFPFVDDDNKYQVYIESMPVEIEGKWGTSVMRKKRIIEIMALLYQTSHVILDKNKVTIRQLGVTHLDEPLPLVTKNISIKGVRGWDEEVVITAGQVDALPMQIMSLAYRVKV